MLQAKKSFWGKKPGFDVGDILHIGVNVLFATVLYMMVVYWHLVPLAVLLVILSKWRILAVQPRFWIPNLKANLVDIIVGISIVSLIQQAEHTWVGILWAALYVGWLLFLKPRTNELWVGLQAFCAQFLGLVTIFTISSIVRTPLLVVALVWIVSWASARHFFSNYEEPHYRSLSLAWAFIISQLAWMSLHWLQYYVVFDTRIASVALVAGIMSGSAGALYHAYKVDKLKHRGAVLENVLFSAALLLVVLVTSSWSAEL